MKLTVSTSGRARVRTGGSSTISRAGAPDSHEQLAAGQHRPAVVMKVGQRCRHLRAAQAEQPPHHLESSHSAASSSVDNRPTYAGKTTAAEATRL